jgi:hypothetical protein
MGIADELQKLEDLRRSGALSEEEFARAKAAVIAGSNTPSGEPLGQHLADQLAEVRYQNELARIDREWQIEREKYMIADKYGRRHVPTAGMGLGAAVVGGVFGALWTIFAFALTSGGPDVGPFPIVKVVFPLFGVVFTVAAVGYGLHAYSKAQQYEKAHAAYQARRRNVRPDQFQ